MFDIESFDYGYYDEGSEGLKVLLLLNIKITRHSVLDNVAGRHRASSGHANNETESLSYSTRNRESDSHHTHSLHGQPPGEEMSVQYSNIFIKFKNRPQLS